MIRDYFKEAIRSKKGCVVIMAGSGSDKEHVDKIKKSLEEYDLLHDTRICSAHKQPSELMGMITEYDAVEGSFVYVAVAGGTDALSGTLAFHSLKAVISCPPNEKGLTSALTNPPGSSNAVISDPRNVGKFVAQIYASSNSDLRKILEGTIAEKIRSLEGADAKFQNAYGEGER